MRTALRAVAAAIAAVVAILGARRVLSGGTAIDPLVVERVMARRRRGGEGVDTLSEREREILAGVTGPGRPRRPRGRWRRAWPR